MLFVGGLIVGSMLSNKNSEALVSRTLEEEQQIFLLIL
jgi:hypothetical protein